MARFDGRQEDKFLALVRAGVLAIDDTGAVWRLQLRGLPCSRKRIDRRTTGGYLQVSIMVAGVLYLASAHRVVNRAKVGPIPVPTGDDEDMSFDDSEDAGRVLSVLAAVTALDLRLPTSWQLRDKIDGVLLNTPFKVGADKIRKTLLGATGA